MPKTKTPKTAARVYRAASYARLSVDDESYGTSGSVLNQHAMIRDFADANGGLSIVAEYSDDGFSGSTFENRPGWGSLLADVETGKVDVYKRQALLTSLTSPCTGRSSMASRMSLSVF